MTQYIIANWKMNGDLSFALEFAGRLDESLDVNLSNSHVIICPSYPFLSALGDAKNFDIGAQNCYDKESGAYTGEVSANFLKDLSCKYVIVGHSERREYFAESNNLVKSKSTLAYHCGITPIICVGESLEVRKSGAAEEFVLNQALESIPDDASLQNSQLIIAYEPIWAIGTGEIATLEQIEKMHESLINGIASKRNLAKSQIIVLYGGSVKAGNSAEILGINSVSGVLVGGASLKVDEFIEIIKNSR